MLMAASDSSQRVSTLQTYVYGGPATWAVCFVQEWAFWFSKICEYVSNFQPGLARRIEEKIYFVLTVVRALPAAMFPFISSSKIASGKPVDQPNRIEIKTCNLNLDSVRKCLQNAESTIVHELQGLNSSLSQS